MTLKGKVQQVIPAQGRVPLEGYVKANTGVCTIVKQPITSSLPGGIFVECCHLA